MRLSLTVDFLAYDSAQPTNDPQDAVKIKKRVEEATITEVNRYFPMAVPDATTDLAIALPASTTDYLLIFTDETVSVKLNGSATAITLKPRASGAKTPAMLIRGDITALTVSNASGKVANLDVVAVKI